MTYMTYDFPLRRDFIVRVTLPLDLTHGEAERLGSFVRALAVTSSYADYLSSRQAVQALTEVSQPSLYKPRPLKGEA